MPRKMMQGEKIRNNMKQTCRTTCKSMKKREKEKIFRIKK
jgi:hypothetical protein